MASSVYHQTPSSSGSTLSPTRWDVFLSFRGIDTRYTFTDYLYDSLDRCGIRTFMDDPELRSGEVISDALVQAIQDSKTYVVVFSENYASSRWCLDELVEILGCHKSKGRSIFPVFYNIEPSTVRHQTGSFNKAFQNHETRFDRERLDKWQVTLMNVADLKGYTVLKNMSQTDIIKKVVDRVLLEINPLTLDVAKYPVGLDSRVKDITTLLSNDTEGVIRIGIHGMGGVGKTTLAKAVYNQNYQSYHGCCFLADVREVSRRENGIVYLQQKLIDSVLKRKNDKIDNVDQGIELIRARICSKKVLIVFDDLDNTIPLEFLEGPFASGSTIIITTRNEDLLDSIEVKGRYKVNELSDAESRQLFSQHAFGDDKIPNMFTELSKEILQHAGGLPLALKVFGSNLFNQPEEAWRWYIDKLKRVSIEDVENKLVISFQALKLLDPMLQNLYLDIACFFIGHKNNEVVKIMETCYIFVNRNIDILKKRCLLTTNDEDELGMHDLLRDMGRKIARNNFPDEPEKHSRLWISNDICDVLKKHKGTEAIECIIPRDNNQVALHGVSFTTETFKRMSKLRFLYLEKVNIIGSFEQTFEDLRLFRWKYCPLKCLPCEFGPQRLVILELPNSQMRTMWELNMVPQAFHNLKTLNMSYSLNLTKTPDFTKLPCLETLNLEGCEGLEEVDISIGSLVRLVSLDLHGCVKLRILPDTICNLRALEILTINHCTSLEALPMNLGNIKSLMELHPWVLTVSQLPDSIGRLSKLVELSLSSNKNLETLPETIFNLISLEILDISGCEKLEVLPDQLWKLTRLRELNACGAILLRKLPDIQSSEISLSLQKLDLSESALTALPSGIYQFSNLEDLVLTDCGHLLSVAELPPNLKWIKAEDCMSMKRLPDLSHLKQLEDLDLEGCSSLTEIQGLEELTSIRTLCLEDCKSSLLAHTFTKRFFQIYSGFGHQIIICIWSKDFPNWIGRSTEYGTTMSLDLQTNVSHDYLGMILCFKRPEDYGFCIIDYTVKTATGSFKWSDTLHGPYYHDSCMVIVPRSIFSVTDEDDRIELTTDGGTNFFGIHLLYKKENRRRRKRRKKRR